MKKLLFVLLLSIAPFSSSFAEGAFDGINLQLGLGASMTKSQESQSSLFNAYGTPVNESFTFNKTNLVGSASLGYSYGF